MSDNVSDEVIALLAAKLHPLEGKDKIFVLADKRTGALYVECHVKASKLVELGTIDVPLDPEEQGDFRANREIVENASAYLQMKDDALQGRS
jgi:hypothetical protein